MASRSWAFVLLLLTASAHAADAGESAVGLSELLRVTLTLALIVVIILGLALGLRRWNGDRVLAPSVFKVLAALSLGGKDRIYLLQVGNEQLVVGSSINGLRKLHTLQEKVTPEQLGLGAPLNGQRFADVLRSLGKGWTP